METPRRIHPLVAVAAVSFIVLTGVGIAAFTGLMPSSTGSSPDSTGPGPAALPKSQKPVGITGTVEAVREVKVKGEGTGAGAVVGGVAGGVLGHQIGEGSGKKLATVFGAAGGAVAGHQVERSARATSRWEISVSLDDGSRRTLTSNQPPHWRAGDRVRMIDGRLQPA